jgi:hypothetical protein
MPDFRAPRPLGCGHFTADWIGDMSRTSRVALIVFISSVAAYFSFDDADLITLCFRLVFIFVSGIIFIRDGKE